MSKPHIVILGCNFAGLTTARYIHVAVKGKADISIIDRKSLLTFVPNIYSINSKQNQVSLPLRR